MVEVIPGILEHNFQAIVDKIRLVEGLCSWVQIDVLDGTLFGNTNFHNPADFATLRTAAKLELHMMVVNPDQLVDQWAAVGIKRFIGHIEGLTNAEAFIAKVRSKKMEVGLAIDIDTDVSIIEPFLPNIDVALVMAIHTGKSGQEFNDKAVIKIRKIRSLASDLPIEVDGGINNQTAIRAVQSGATRLVSTSYLFNSPSLIQAIHKLQQV